MNNCTCLVITLKSGDVYYAEAIRWSAANWTEYTDQFDKVDRHVPTAEVVAIVPKFIFFDPDTFAVKYTYAA